MFLFYLLPLVFSFTRECGDEQKNRGNLIKHVSVLCSLGKKHRATT